MDIKEELTEEDVQYEDVKIIQVGGKCGCTLQLNLKSRDVDS